MKTVVRMKFGSHLYGTSTPESDLDFKGVYVPSGADILLQRVQGSVSTKRPKAEGEKNFVGEVDEELYSLQRYLGLLSEGQTVAIDMLFATDDVLLETSPTWNAVRENRHRLVTRRSAAFVGYCRTQANKYGIKGSRVAAARKVAEFLERELAARGTQAKLYEIETELRSLADEHTSVVELPAGPGNSQIIPFLECCNRKIALNNTIKHAAEVYGKVRESYGNRAQLAEKNEGIDWKALSHAVRVGQEALELLRTGAITFPVGNAEEILAIKRGLVPYDQVARQIEQLLEEVERAAESSPLPEAPDHNFIDALVAAEYRKAVLA